ncbi:glycosyltransferase family protein [Alphaproteobacteria bacterium]|nr:glycosyltransferase family protein [Alphaproteobacteria bacterium]
MKKILGIVQARMESKRFPGKVLKVVKNKSLLELLLNRLIISKKINQIIVVTTKQESDNVIAKLVNNLGLNLYRGSTTNVLESFYNAALNYQAEIIVRITGDCPIIDPNIVDNIIEYYLSNNYDYVSNTINPTYPDGLDVEVFSFKTLRTAYNSTNLKHNTEHVTPYIKNSNKFLLGSFENSNDYSENRWTVDYEVDFKLIEKIVSYFYPRINFSMKEILEYKILNPEIFEINKHIKRNEGSSINEKEKEKEKRVNESLLKK